MPPRPCHRCGAVPPPDTAGLLGWGWERVGDTARWLCPRCLREHARDIESRLQAEWWA